MIIEMEDLLSKWRKEQIEIASKVKVLDDDPTKLKDHPDSSQYPHVMHSIKDKLIGGVDVSFGENDSAVAVYVVTRNHDVIYKNSLIFTITQPYVSSFLG